MLAARLNVKTRTLFLDHVPVPLSPAPDRPGSRSAPPECACPTCI